MYTFHQMGQYKTSLERQIRESLIIDSYDCDNVLNGKGEWGHNLVPRARFDETDGPQFTKTRLNRNRPDSIENSRQNASQDASEETGNNQETDISASHFENQLSQRRKKRKQMNAETSLAELDNQEPVFNQPGTSSGMHHSPRIAKQALRRMHLNVKQPDNKVPVRMKQTVLNFVVRKQTLPPNASQ